MRNIFNIASLLAAAVMLFSCEEIGDTQKESEGQDVDSSMMLVLTSDKDVIQADGQDVAVLKVMYGDKDVTSESIIYTDKDEELNLDGGKFTASSVGEYKFYAEYGTLTTYDKKADNNGLYVIKAISVSVPDAVPDTDLSNTSFVHRTFLAQYTGTGCKFCPLMVKVIRDLMGKNVIPEKAVHAAVHSYGAGDPAYISAPRVTNYPYLTLDLVQGFSAEQGADYLGELIDAQTFGSAKAGISVNPLYYESEGTLVVKVAVKAAVDGLYNVGAWLLEDDIYGQQTVYEQYRVFADESYNTHENCVRIADSKYFSTWFGHALGTIAKGASAERTFVMNIDKTWKVEKLHLAVFASYGEQNGSKVTYTVCNAVDVPIDAPTPFEYVK